MKTKLQLQQIAAQLLNLKDIRDRMQLGSPDRLTMDTTIAMVYSTQIASEQNNEFMTIYNSAEKARIDTLYRRSDSEVEA